MEWEHRTVFAVDDDEGELELLERVLDELPNIEIELHRYTDPNLALIEFMNHNAELIFLDYQLGDLTAIDLLEQMRRVGDQRPAIVLTGHGDEYAAAELTRAGADDYIIKSDLGVEICRNAIARALAAYAKRLSEAEVVRHAFELERANEQLEKAKRDLEEMNARLRDRSDTDPITAIPNRRCFESAGEKELARSERTTSVLSVALLDVDRFSDLCDRHGKLVGEQILKKVSSVDPTRRGDISPSDCCLPNDDERDPVVDSTPARRGEVRDEGRNPHGVQRGDAGRADRGVRTGRRGAGLPLALGPRACGLLSRLRVALPVLG